MSIHPNYDGGVAVPPRHGGHGMVNDGKELACDRTVDFPVHVPPSKVKNSSAEFDAGIAIAVLSFILPHLWFLVVIVAPKIQTGMILKLKKNDKMIRYLRF